METPKPWPPEIKWGKPTGTTLIVLPEIDLSHDDGDQSWHDAGGQDMTPEYKEDGTVKHYRWNGLGPGHYAEYWRLCVVESWEETVIGYEHNPDDVYHAWWYVDNHPVFWQFKTERNKDYPANHVSHLVHGGAFSEGWPAIIPHKVNPDTMRIEKDRSLNTMVEWWYEFGPTDLFGGCKSHDYKLDGGAATYEQCVIEVAAKIHKYYGNDRMLVDREDYWDNRVVDEDAHGWGHVHEKLHDRDTE